MPLVLILTPLLFGLSGMLGLGVAFIAIPVLGLFGYDLINVIQPWALLLNGLTAISAAVAFWRKGMVDKRGALILVTITTVCAPIGVWLLQFATVDLVWWLYVGVLLFLAFFWLSRHRLFHQQSPLPTSSGGFASVPPPPPPWNSVDHQDRSPEGLAHL